jgi:hypothetical protein
MTRFTQTLTALINILFVAGVAGGITVALGGTIA